MRDCENGTPNAETGKGTVRPSMAQVRATAERILNDTVKNGRGYHREAVVPRNRTIAPVAFAGLLLALPLAIWTLKWHDPVADVVSFALVAIFAALYLTAREQARGGYIITSMALPKRPTLVQRVALRLLERMTDNS